MEGVFVNFHYDSRIINSFFMCYNRFCLFVFSVPGIFHCWFEDFLDVKKISVFFSWDVRDALYLYLLNKFLL